ncbi:AAA domain-containing protein [Panaeolus papilionaceus]|nr:AAA domain-containing protein [Panaeolus papilionaceus]
MDSSMPQILSSQDTIVQLTENFRLNPDLGEFVSTIYSRQFKAQKFQAKQLAISLTSLDNHDSFDEAGFMKICDVGKEFLSALGHVMLRQPQLLLSPPEIDSKASSKEPQDAALTHRPVSLSLIRLSTWSSSTHRVEYEAHVRTEATLAAALVFWLRQCSPGDDIFVATPHRIQREAVKNALRSLHLDVDRTNSPVGAGTPSSTTRPLITVDTIERLQGSEAAFVICLFSLPRSASSDLGFLLERRRLNVAISRAKTMCILISSEEVLCPPVRVLADENVVKGYTFLKAYEKRAWTFVTAGVKLS